MTGFNYEHLKMQHQRWTITCPVTDCYSKPSITMYMYNKFSTYSKIENLTTSETCSFDFSLTNEPNLTRFFNTV